MKELLAATTRLLGLDTETTHRTPGVGWPWETGLVFIEKIGETTWREKASHLTHMSAPLHWKTRRPSRECNLHSLDVCGRERAIKAIENGLPPDKALRDINRWICENEGGPFCPIVAFNVPFDSAQVHDIGYLGGHHRSYVGWVPGQVEVSGVWLDPMVVERRLHPGAEISLSASLRRWWLPEQESDHDAVSDARSALRLLLSQHGHTLIYHDGRLQPGGGANA